MDNDKPGQNNAPVVLLGGNAYRMMNGALQTAAVPADNCFRAAEDDWREVDRRAWDAQCEKALTMLRAAALNDKLASGAAPGGEATLPATVLSLLEQIARRNLRVPTLEPRGRDHLDFHDVGVNSISAALAAAYQVGVATASAGADLGAAGLAGPFGTPWRLQVENGYATILQADGQPTIFSDLDLNSDPAVGIRCDQDRELALLEFVISRANLPLDQPSSRSA